MDFAITAEQAPELLGCRGAGFGEALGDLAREVLRHIFSGTDVEIIGEALNQLSKADPALASIPVIVVSNSCAPEDIEEVYRLQGNSYLTKPADLDDLFDMVRALVDFWFRKAQIPKAVCTTPALPE